MENIKICDYRPEWQPYFEHFNKAWLEEYFRVEPVDRWVLEKPEEALLQDGGKILFAVHEGRPVGTVGLRVVEPGTLELTKMAVDKPFQGRGAGKLLCRTAIQKAREMGAHRLILYSQTSLGAAISIYRKLGFREIPMEKGAYERADIKMELSLERAHRQAGRYFWLE